MCASFRRFALLEFIAAMSCLYMYVSICLSVPEVINFTSENMSLKLCECSMHHPLNSVATFCFDISTSNEF